MTSKLPTRMILALPLAAVLAMPAFADGNLRHSLKPVTEPEIAEVRGRTVRVRVPEGMKSITLQRKTGRRATPWVTLSQATVDDSKNVVTFTLRSRMPRHMLRVFGQQKGKLPSAFYTGTTNFLGEKVVSVPGPNMNLGGGVGVLGAGAAGNFDSAVKGEGAASARTVTESDIWKVDGDRLYFFNHYRGLQNIDITDISKPALLGTLHMPAAGEDLYQLDAKHVAILKRTPKELGWTSGSPTFDQANQSGELVVCDVSGGEPAIVSRVSFDGSVANSRLIGSALVMARNVPAPSTDQWGWKTNLEVTGYDLSNPAAPIERNTVTFSNGDGSWVSAVQSSNERFMVARPDYNYNTGGYSTNIHLVDVTNPDGTLVRGGSVAVKGHVPDKFKMHEKGGVMSIVSAVSEQTAAGGWTQYARLQNFDVSDAASPKRLGAITVGHDESTRAVRFDGDRVYIVTVVQQDPLWIIDNTDPAKPTLTGELHVPGFSSYIEPLGDRLVTVGRLWGDDGTGNWQNRVAVSLYDVSDPANPVQLSQLPVGTGWSSSEAEWDEKAFTVLPDAGLVMLPFGGSWWHWGSADGGVQLIDLKRDSLALRGVIRHGFTPRRTAIKDDAVLALSPSDLLTVDISDRDNPVVKADVELAWNVDRNWIVGDRLLQIGAHLADRKPVISVSPLSNPDDTISSLELGEGEVQAASLTGDLLYVVQSVRSAANGVPDLKLGVFSVASLPQIVKLGESTATGAGTYGEVSMVFPSGATAVVSRRNSSGYWWRPMPIEGDVIALGAPVVALNEAPQLRVAAVGGAALVADRAMPIWGGWGWPGDGSMELHAFDISNSRAPKFIATTRVKPANASTFSKPFAANGRVFASHFTGGYYDVIALDDDAAKVRTANRHFLNVVDFSDPAAPVIKPPVSLPGTLENVAMNGELLHVTGPGYDAAGRPDGSKQFLHAVAFDGAAHLVSSIALGERWSGNSVRFTAANVFVNRISYDAATGRADAQLEAWALEDDGRFVQRDAVDIPTAYDWTLRNDLAVFSNGGASLTVADIANPADLKNAGTFQGWSSWGYPSLDRDGGVAGDLTRGLWIPAGDFGVRSIPAPK